MGASFVKSCFVGEPSAELAAHREARRRYERQSLLQAREALQARRCGPRSPSERPAAAIGAGKKQSREGVELPRSAVRLLQLRAREPENESEIEIEIESEKETPAVQIERRRRGRDGRKASPAPSESESGALTASESSFDDDSPLSLASVSLHSSPSESAQFSFRALLPQDYQLECVVGRGTTSTCYRCARRSDGRRFACKIIEKRRLAASPRKRAEIAVQLRREVDVLRSVDHPNIAKLEAAFENEAFLILVMELLEGGELFDAIVEKGRFSEPEAVHVARSVLAAIKHMHQRGIVHRDLKPENMLLAVSRKRRTGTGPGMTVKIIDFGFAKVLEHGATSSSFLGTGGYLAPEILLHQPYATPVDMWSFGVLVYLLLCGRLPFAATTQLRPNQRVASLYKLTFPRKYWHGVSPLAMDFLQRVLVLNPSARLTASEALKHPWLRL